MKCIIGLGNPGEVYENTRHNLGFLALDYLAKEWNASPFILKKKCLISEVNRSDQKILLLKPHTFMNLSGEGAGPWIRFYQIPSDQIAIIFDDLDIPNGQIKMKIGGGAAGHNGLKSLDQHISQFQNTLRVKFGIGKPTQESVAHYVLGRLQPDEYFNFEKNVKKLPQAMTYWILNQTPLAMNDFNKKD